MEHMDFELVYAALSGYIEYCESIGKGQEAANYVRKYQENWFKENKKE